MVPYRRAGAPAAAFLIAMAVYRLTLAPDLSWAHFGGDSGELVTAVTTLGVPHPPGYPTYVLVGKLFSLLPIGTAAYRLNLFSAFCTALAAGFITAAGGRLIRQMFPAAGQIWGQAVPALAAGLTFAFAPLVWGQALISEVYGLNLLCLALLLWCLVTSRPSWLIGLLWGLSLTTHLSSLLLLPLLLYTLPRRDWAWFALGAGAGLTPFLLLPLLAASGSPVVWGRPDTLAGWWWLVSAQVYRPYFFSLTAVELLHRGQAWLVELPAQFLGLGVVMVLAGAFRRSSTPAGRLRYGRLAWLLTAVAYIGYAFVYGTADALVLVLPALLLCAVLLAPGLYGLGAAALSLPLLLLLLNFQTLNLSHDDEIRPLAQTILAQAPDGAILLSSDPNTTFALWYYHAAEKQRPDLLVVDNHLFAFDWYRDRLGQQRPVWLPAGDDLDAFARRNQAAWPVCQVQLTPAAALSC